MAAVLFGDIFIHEVELFLGIEGFEFGFEGETRFGDDRKSAPLDIGGSEHVLHQVLGFDVSFVGHDAGIGVFDFGFAVF